MNLSTPTRLDPPRGLRRGNTTIHPVPSTNAVRTQHVVSVEFVSCDGRVWQAVGGGNTLAAAVAFAHDSCPTDSMWEAVRWNELYGD
jgi:hypothetical protein